MTELNILNPLKMQGSEEISDDKIIDKEDEGEGEEEEEEGGEEEEEGDEEGDGEDDYLVE